MQNSATLRSVGCNHNYWKYNGWVFINIFIVFLITLILFSLIYPSIFMLIYDSMFNHLTTCTYKLFGLNDSLEPSTISYKVTQSKGSILIRLYLVWRPVVRPRLDNWTWITNWFINLDLTKILTNELLTQWQENQDALKLHLAYLPNFFPFEPEY